MINSAQKTIGLSVVVLLFIPLIAMQITKEVNWSAFDFLAMGILLTGMGFTSEYFYRKIKSPKMKLLTVLLIVILFFLLWAELAVGIFNSPISGS